MTGLSKLASANCFAVEYTNEPIKSDVTAGDFHLFSIP
jgi:hypothetical protein